MLTKRFSILALMLFYALLGSIVHADTDLTSEHVVTRSYNPAQIHGLDVDLSVATLRINSNAGSVMTVKVTRRLAGGSPSSDDRLWLSGSGLVIQQSGTVLEVRDHPKGGDNDIDDHDNSRKQMVVIDMPANVPVSLNDGVGAVDVRGPVQKLDGNLGMGDALLQDAGVDGQPDASKFNVGMGKLRAVWTRAVSGGVDLNSGMGSLDIFLCKDQKASVTASSGMGSVSIDFPGASVDQEHESVSGDATARLNGGGDRIKLSTGVGKVTLGASTK